MDGRTELKILAWLLAGFLFFYFLPVDSPAVAGAIQSAFALAHWYAQEHVLLCLIPAFFIAGGIAVFVSQGAVLRYFGAQANRWLAYGVASVSGGVLAVCSCTVLPLFAGIYKRGAGLGPAMTFLYSGPAINVLAMVLTARILGLELGLARAVGAVLFGIVIGLLMAWLFRHEEAQKAANFELPPEEVRPLWQTGLYFGSMVGILVFATWAPADSGFWAEVYAWKWWLVGGFGLLLAWALWRLLGIAPRWIALAGVPVLMLAGLFPHLPMLAFVAGLVGLSVLLALNPGGPGDWLGATWDSAKQITPLLAAGVLAAGFLLGTPEGGAGVIPNQWVAALVGGNSLTANLFAAVVGAFMYFATLTEVPIVQGLLNSGMGQGPALALLLAGPALSLPSMLVIHSVIGTAKTAVYIGLVVIMATLCGWLFGLFMSM